MPDYHALTSALTFSGKNVVVVGGTQGIGAGIALRFAELGASVLIVGRNEGLGINVVKTLEAASRQESDAVASTARFSFARRDLGSVDEIRGAVEDIATWAGNDGIHYLYLSQGGPSAITLPFTVQSMTVGFNVQILSHFLIPYLLLSRPEPILRTGAQICNIARPGLKNQTIDLNDFRALKAVEAGRFWPYPGLMAFIFMLDVFTKEFNVKFPDIHTTHLCPGAVVTSSLYSPNVPWFIKLLFKYIVWPLVGRSTAQYADVVIWETASEEGKKLNRTFWDEHGRNVVVDKRVETDVQLREAVWDNLVKLGEASQ